MSFWRLLYSAIAALCMTWAGGVAAESGRSAGYIGFGAAPSGEDQAQEKPIAFGMYHVDQASRFMAGVDIGLEGTTLDGTYGVDTLERGLSFNVILGRNLYHDAVLGVDMGILLGMREVALDCPDSFLGFACYADRPPEAEYELNLGGVATVSVNNLLVGLRATDVSAQVLVGFNF